MAGQFPSFKKSLGVIEREALFARRRRNISSAIRPEYSISKSRLFLWNANFGLRALIPVKNVT
jgi:hypothetical protein